MKMMASETMNMESNRFIGKEIKKEADSSSRKNSLGFIQLFITSQVLGLLSIIFLLYWIFVYAGGLRLNLSPLWNWHSILLSFGFIYLTGTGMLVFRFLHTQPKNILKLIHAAVLGLSSILAIVGIWIAFQHRFDKGKSQLYTMHSWIGILTLIVHLTQIIVGFLAYLYPKFSTNTRTSLMPYHTFIGQTVLALSVVSVVTGINEICINKLGDKYAQRNIQGVLLNLSGLLFTLFSILVVYISSSKTHSNQAKST